MRVGAIDIRSFERGGTLLSSSNLVRGEVGWRAPRPAMPKRGRTWIGTTDTGYGNTTVSREEHRNGQEKDIRGARPRRSGAHQSRGGRRGGAHEAGCVQ